MNDPANALHRALMDNPTHKPAPNAPAVVKFNGPKEVLIAARKLIEKPEHWTTDTLCRARDGAIVTPGSKRAFSFCIDGALYHALGSINADNLDVLHMMHAACGCNAIDFNDAPERKHAEVLAAFDKAIASAP